MRRNIYILYDTGAPWCVVMSEKDEEKRKGRKSRERVPTDDKFLL